MLIVTLAKVDLRDQVDLPFAQKSRRHRSPNATLRTVKTQRGFPQPAGAVLEARACVNHPASCQSLTIANPVLHLFR